MTLLTMYSFSFCLVVLKYSDTVISCPKILNLMFFLSFLHMWNSYEPSIAEISIFEGFLSDNDVSHLANDMQPFLIILTHFCSNSSQFASMRKKKPIVVPVLKDINLPWVTLSDLTPCTPILPSNILMNLHFITMQQNGSCEQERALLGCYDLKDEIYDIDAFLFHRW